MRKFVFLTLFIAIVSVSASAQQRFVASLDGLQEVPANGSAGRGHCNIVLNAAETQITVNCVFSGLGTNLSAAHIHGNAGPGANAGVLFNFTGLPGSTSGTIGPLNFGVSPAQVANMRAHLWYVNLHSSGIPSGEIRGQIKQVHTVYDVDGDGRTDPTVFRQSTNTFWILRSLNPSSFITYPLGTGTGDIFLNNTYDFDGDGRGDPLLLKLDGSANATWTIYQTRTNTVRTFVFGVFTTGVGDTLAMADYDGDGMMDPAVFRRSNGQWWIIQSSAPSFFLVDNWGTTNDFPSVGDYDGDGRADLTAVRVESGNRVWYTRLSTTGLMRRTVFGSSATDSVFFFAPFDIDGDGKQDIMVTRVTGSSRVYHILRSSDGAYTQIQWGLGTPPADTQLFGDFDGDGKTDICARRVISGSYVWHILRSSDGNVQYYWWGTTGDQLTEEPSDEYINSFVSTGGPDE